MLPLAILLGVFAGHALYRMCTAKPEPTVSRSVPLPGGSATPPPSAHWAGPTAGGDVEPWLRDAWVFVLPCGTWARVVCTASGPNGCWVGVRFPRGRVAAFPDFELTR